MSFVREFWWCDLVRFFFYYYCVWFWLHKFGYAILVGFDFVNLAQGFGYVSLARECRFLIYRVLCWLLAQLLGYLVVRLIDRLID